MSGQPTCQDKEGQLMKHTEADPADELGSYPIGHWPITIVHRGLRFNAQKLHSIRFSANRLNKTHHGQSYGKFSDAFKLTCTSFGPVTSRH